MNETVFRKQTAPFAHPHRNIAALGVQPGMKVADFGAGSGAYVLAIAEALGGSGTVYAIDIQKDLLRRIKNEATRRGFHTVEVLWSDLDIPGASKIKDRALDLVLISNLLFQIEDKDALLTEARRILKRNGRVALIDWSVPILSSGTARHTIGPKKEDVVTMDAAIALAVRAGFELDRKFSAGAHHYGLIFKNGMES